MDYSKNRKCFRCLGRKKIYKLGGVYTLESIGGKEVICPLCAGEGVIDEFAEIIKKNDDDAKMRKTKHGARASYGEKQKNSKKNAQQKI